MFSAVQHRPDVVFAGLPGRHVGARKGLHRRHRDLAGMNGAAHRANFVGAFHRARLLGQLLAFHDLEPLRLQRAQAVHHRLVHRDAAVARRVLRQQAAHLVGEDVGGHVDPVAPREVEQVRARAPLAHQRVEFAQERRVAIVPDHHVAIRAEQRRAERVVRVPELHVGGVGGVANVERVEHQQPGIVARHDGLRQPLPPVAAHGLQVRQLQPRRRPFVEGQPRRPDLAPVGIVRRGIARAWRRAPGSILRVSR